MVDFVTGNHLNVLQPGELLRSVHLPAAALTKRSAFRHMLADQARPLGGAVDRHQRRRRRPAADHHRGDPSSGAAALRARAVRGGTLRDAIETQVPADRWFDDVHGSAPYKRHVTRYFAEQIRAELAAGGAA